VAKLLLANGAKVDQADNAGNAPLSASRRHGHEEVVKLLLAHIEKADQAKEEEEKETREAKGASTGKVRVCENCGKEAATMKRCKFRLARYCSDEWK